jgi:PIN domain nuclease of toxin-antitoxin system
LGKLELKTHFSKVAELIENNGFQILPVTFQDTLILSGLPFHHRDPFDRMIIAQAITNNLNTITADKNFSDYPITIIW